MLTNNLKDEGRFVIKVLYPHTNLVLSRVISLCCADEQNAVSISATDIDSHPVQGLAILSPSDHWLGFALGKAKRTIQCKEKIMNISFCCLYFYNTYNLFSADVSGTLTEKGMVRLILSPTYATYLCLRKRGRRTLGSSKLRAKYIYIYIIYKIYMYIS